VITPEHAKSVRDAYKARLESELKAAPAHVPTASMLGAQWAGMVWPASPEADANPATGVAREVLEEVGRASVTVPSGFVRASCVGAAARC
jgi:probable 2-oxoglutarate dehydrogenase E1 component DHKTD1